MALSINPQVWEDFIVKQMPITNNIINGGIVKFVEAPNIRAGDTSWRKPFLKSLDSLGTDDVQATTSTTVTYQALTDANEIFPIIRRVDGISQNDIVTVTSGIDAMLKIAPQIADRVTRQLQVKLNYLLSGIYNTSTGPLKTSHVLDYSGSAITASMIDEAAETKLGEVWSECDTVIMNSKTKRTLQDDIKSSLTTLANGNTVLTEYLGQYRIIVNNTLCAVSGTDYPVWVLAGSPLTIGWQRKLNLETSRDATTYTNRLQWMYHAGIGLDGVSMTADADNPTTAELADGANYTTVAESAKNIRMVKLIAGV